MALLLTGCASTVRILSSPTGARLELADGRVLATPTQVRFTRTPGRAQPILVTREGFEPVTIDLQRTQGRLIPWIEGVTLPRSGRELTVVLVPAAAPVAPAAPAAPAAPP